MTLPATLDELRANGGVMIHLPRLQWRAEHSLAKLREAGFENIALEEGVDALLVDARAAAEREGWFFDPGLGDGEIGCSVAMLRLWKRVLDEELPYLLVFEDDVLPHPDVSQLGAEYWDQTPPDAEFVLMGNQMWRPDIAALDDPGRLVVSLPASCLHAYVITQSGARRGLELVARELAKDRWLSTIDMELWRWMRARDVRYACWNGTMLPKALPSADEFDRDAVLPPDVARSTCGNTGPFVQNFSLGSAIWPEREPPVPRWAAHRDNRRAVLLSAWVPGVTGNGSAIRVGVALEALAGQYDVDLVLVPVWGPLAIDDWASKLTRRSLVLTEAEADPFLRRIHEMESVSERLRALIVYPRPMSVKFSTPDAAQQIVEFTGGDVDLVYAFRLALAPLAAPWLPHTRFVLDVDEDDARALRQIAELHRIAGYDGDADVAEADAEKVARMADTWIPRADLVLASGEPEVMSLRTRYPDVRADVFPNPSPQTGDEGTAPEVDLLLVGNCSYRPNIDAAQWLCGEVLPLLRRQLGRSVRLAIVGSAVDPSVAALAGRPDVTVVADAPSVTPWYRATTISVAPLRAGGGTRLKILESFTHRRPVVSTSLGAEGLPVQDRIHLLIADGAEDFAHACARLLRDHTLRAALVDAAVEVAITHARPRVVKDLAETLAALTHPHAAMAP